MMRFAVRWGIAKGICAQRGPATDRVLQVVVLLFELLLKFCNAGYFKSDINRLPRSLSAISALYSVQ